MNVYSNFKHLIDEPNKNAIKSLEIKCIQSRLTREYDDLYNKFPNSIIYVYYNEKLKNINFNIRIDEENKTQNYVFIIDKKYPFHPPKILFNNKPYSHFLRLPSYRFSIYLQKIFMIKCLCCSSLECKYNWSPGINITMIINEINKIRKYKQNIIIYILIKQIKDKYLVDDLDIFSYILRI